MRQTLLLALFSFFISMFMNACTSPNASQVADNMVDSMAVVGNPGLSSDPCAAIDQKMIRLDRFTEVVKHTSAFHLEEKANAIPTPGITVSNNRAKMLKDAEKKYAEYALERQKYGCETPAHITQETEKMAILDSCTALDEKIIRLDRFTEVVQHTSAFHLEEKASALPSPGFSVSNNKKQMLRDAKKKRTEYLEERQKLACKTPLPVSTVKTVEKIPPEKKNTITDDTEKSIDKELHKADEPRAKTDQAGSTSQFEEKDAVVSSPAAAPVSQTEKRVETVDKRVAAVPVKQKKSSETAKSISSIQETDQIIVSDHMDSSSEACDDLNKELIELNAFKNMVENTSAFHLEEKISALPSPGITVSNNKKKMLRDVEKKRKKLTAEYQKAGCEAN